MARFQCTYVCLLLWQPIYVYRELHSYVYHNICSKIGGVKNTVGTIRTNVKLAFFKPVFKCVMLNRST